MPITNDQIVNGLISFYKQNGLDMSGLLFEPTFTSMSTADKVQAIKDYAGVLYNNSADGLSKTRKLDHGWSMAERIGQGALAGAAAGSAIATGVAVVNSARKIPIIPNLSKENAIYAGLGMAIMAGVSGAGAAYLKYKQELAKKKALRTALLNSSLHNTVESAVHVLPHLGGARETLRGVLANKILDKVDSYYQDTLPIHAQNAAYRSYKSLVEQRYPDRASEFN